MQEAHRRGVIHRDLKPSNIHITPGGEPVIMDFGIARRIDKDGERLTRTGQLMGTPEFMAPEQLSDNVTNARTDIYQAAALIYTMVTRQPPFSGLRDEVVHRVMQERPADPSSMVTKIAWQLDWVLQRALSKDPADRFGAAREFGDGLRLGLQESIGAPLGVPKAPIAKEAWAGAEKSLTPRPAKQPPAPWDASARRRRRKKCAW